MEQFWAVIGVKIFAQNAKKGKLFVWSEQAVFFAKNGPPSAGVDVPLGIVGMGRIVSRGYFIYFS